MQERAQEPNSAIESDMQGLKSAAEDGEELQAALEAYEVAASKTQRPHKDMRGSFLKEVSKAFSSVCAALLREHEALQATEQDNARVLNHRYATRQLGDTHSGTS